MIPITIDSLISDGALWRPSSDKYKSSDKAVPFLVPEIDGYLPSNGLPVGCFHEFISHGSQGVPIIIPLSVAANARIAESKQIILWLGQKNYLPTPFLLERLKIPTEQFLILSFTNTERTFWAIEQAIRSRSVAAVCIELKILPVLKKTAIQRRLEIAARESGATLICTDYAVKNKKSFPIIRWARSSWSIAPLVARAPAWNLTLEHYKGPVVVPHRWQIQLLEESEYGDDSKETFSSIVSAEFFSGDFNGGDLTGSAEQVRRTAG
jgi:hypothetical protein